MLRDLLTKGSFRRNLVTWNTTQHCIWSE